MYLYKYVSKIAKQLSKQKLNIFILSFNDLNECININFHAHNCYILVQSNIEKQLATHKYKAIGIFKQELPLYNFDITVCSNLINFTYILDKLQTIFFYCKNNSHLLANNYTIVNTFLFKHKIYCNLQNNKIIQKKICIKNNQISQQLMTTTFPILIRSYNRLSNLYYTLNSIYSSILYNAQITIVDDYSNNENLLKFYNTNQQIYFSKDECININNIKTEKYIGNIPPLPQKIMGIKDKINIHRFSQNYGDCQGLMKTIKYGFQKYPDAPFIIVVEDDIVFNKHWLTQLLIIYQNYTTNLGIASVYNTCHAKEQLTDLYRTIQETVGLTLLITKQLYLYLKEKNYLEFHYLQHPIKSVIQRARKKINDRQHLQPYNCSGDTHLSWYSNDANLKIITTAVQFVQHLDLHNSVCNSDLNTHLRIAKNFVKPYTFNPQNINNSHVLIQNPERILIFSNINIDKYKIQQLNITNRDLLVFLNKADNINLFEQYSNKIIFHRFSLTDGYFGLQKNIQLNIKHYMIDGPKTSISNTQLQQLIENYSKEFYAQPHVIAKNKINDFHKMRQGPTTGWAVQFLMKLRYPNSKIQLINFFPTTDNSTSHFTGHDWKFENEYYQTHKEIKIYDLRISNNTNMNIVYITDNNQIYKQLMLLSIKSVLKIHPTANITIVSSEKITGITYNNIILQDLKNIQLKHNKNDHISSATYLKLILTKLPFDKCLLIDPDTLILNDLQQLYNMDIQYIGCTQSHVFGKIQAKQLQHQKYFLAGIMLLNLKKLRTIDFYEKVINIYTHLNNQKYNIQCWQHQETILNMQFYDLITEIPTKYNYCFNRKYNNQINYENVNILHFPGKDKNAMYTIAKFKNIS